MLLHNSDLTVIELRKVFEHHRAMTPVSLEAFKEEYPLTFPISIDQTGHDDPIPVTSCRYQIRGATKVILHGRDSSTRHHGFGQEEDMALGAILGSLLAKKAPEMA